MMQHGAIVLGTLDQAMAEHRMRGSAPVSSGLPPDEERRLIHAQLDMHYRQRLDEPIPMLGDISPRKAAKTAKGRVGRSSAPASSRRSPMPGQDRGRRSRAARSFSADTPFSRR